MSTETREVAETVLLNGEPCEMIRTEKVPVVVETFFEWNGAEILSNKPTETYSEDGKHLLNLMFFSIGGREIGNTVTFKVFLIAKHGRVYIGENQVNATIISKGSSAGNLPWDGTITIDESIKPIIVGKRKTALGNILDTATAVFNTPTESPDDVEIIGEIAVKARTIRIDGIDDSVDTSTSS
jgi:hypothetical protein